jgi:uncharacterized membrane protein YedE/YeeE
MDWTQFDPLRAFAGGALIGFAAFMLMLRLGRMAGISGILAAAAFQSDGERLWRLAFLIGIVLGAAVMAISAGGFNPTFAGPWWWLIPAGLLVGYGTRLGSGCTSGHGICGLARFSKRSLAATLLFMASAIVTVFVIRHLIGV